MKRLSDAERKSRASARDKAYYAANRERVKAKVRVYNLTHKEEKRDYDRRRQESRRPQQAVYRRIYYLKHRAEQIARLSGRRARNRALIAEAKRGGCVDCGIKDIRVLDFDHVRGAKSFTISNGNNVGKQKLFTEIAKCEVRCANCHRIRTVERRLLTKSGAA